MTVKRSLTVEIGSVDVTKGWADATIKVIDYQGWQGKKHLTNVATIQIKSPSDVRELRRALTQIENYWREELTPP